MAEQTMRSVAYVSDGAAAAADGNEGQYCRIMALNAGRLLSGGQKRLARRKTQC